MGQFSWIYSDTNKQVLDNKKADTYLLVPPQFQEKYGKAIYEWCYDGYGNFGGYDVYELIAEWNREYLSEAMLNEKPKLENYGGIYNFEKEALRKEGVSEEEIDRRDHAQRREYFERAIKRYNQTIELLNDYKNGMSDEDMTAKYNSEWQRYIGIDIACYDEQNARLPFPIKITTKELEYNDVAPSLSDPNQGWLMDEDEEDYDGYNEYFEEEDE